MTGVPELESMDGLLEPMNFQKLNENNVIAWLNMLFLGSLFTHFIRSTEKLVTSNVSEALEVHVELSFPVRNLPERSVLGQVSLPLEALVCFSSCNQFSTHDT